MQGWTAGLVVAGLALGAGAVVTGQTRAPERVTGGEWVQMSRPELVETSAQVMARPDIPFTATEEIIRIRSLEMDWDIAGMVYAPKDASAIPVGADGKKAGLFLLHGGSSDHRSMDRFARFLVSKYGYKIVTMSYPGRLNLQDASRDWPGDTIKGDGTVRTPVWLRDSLITPDQYTIVEDKEESRRRRWGTLILACGKEGTEFYDRMAGWPVRLRGRRQGAPGEAPAAGGVLDLRARPLDRWSVHDDLLAAGAERRRHHRHGELAVRRDVR